MVATTFASWIWQERCSLGHVGLWRRDGARSAGAREAAAAEGSADRSADYQEVLKSGARLFSLIDNDRRRNAPRLDGTTSLLCAHKLDAVNKNVRRLFFMTCDREWQRLSSWRSWELNRQRAVVDETAAWKIRPPTWEPRTPFFMIVCYHSALWLLLVCVELSHIQVERLASNRKCKGAWLTRSPGGLEITSIPLLGKKTKNNNPTESEFKPNDSHWMVFLRKSCMFAFSSQSELSLFLFFSEPILPLEKNNNSVYLHWRTLTPQARH